MTQKFIFKNYKKCWKKSIGFVFFILVLCIICIKILYQPNIVFSGGDYMLKTLPYIHYGLEKADVLKNGVVFFNKEKSFSGYTLIDRTLIDMEGNEILNDVGHYFDYSDDSFYSFHPEKGLIKYNINMETDWQVPFIAHHDLEILDDSILVVSRKLYEHNNEKIFFDEVIHVSKDGKIIDIWSTFDNLEKIQKYHEPIDYFINVEGDFFPEYYHMNAISVIPENQNEMDTHFRRGNWIISLHNPNLILILDKDTKEIVWTWGPGKILGQHKPVMLSTGNILVLDNGKGDRNYSRLIEIDPIKKELVWEYKGDPPESFHTAFGGFIQVLPNGNILVTEGEKGRVFEVTRNKEIVWEWYNPEIDEEGYRIMLQKAERFSESAVEKLLSS